MKRLTHRKNEIVNIVVTAQSLITIKISVNKISIKETCRRPTFWKQSIMFAWSEVVVFCSCRNWRKLRLRIWHGLRMILLNSWLSWTLQISAKVFFVSAEHSSERLQRRMNASILSLSEVRVKPIQASVLPKLQRWIRCVDTRGLDRVLAMSLTQILTEHNC